MTLVDVTSKRRLGLFSPLRYPGGKSKLAGFFADVIAEANLKDVTYVEPFAGGAGAGLALLQSGLVERVVINDLDVAVNSFWRALVEANDEIVERIRITPLTIEEWERQREIYRASDSRAPVELGFAFFYLNRTNRSGVLHAGVIGGKAQAGRYRIDARFNRDELARRVRNIGEVAERITVSLDDGRKCFARWADEPNTFLYIDPPYVQAGGSLYLNAFNERDHAELANAVNAHANANWLMTYDDSSLIRNLYTDRSLFDFELHYSAHRVGRARELLVASDPISGLVRSRRASK